MRNRSFQSTILSVFILCGTVPATLSASLENKNINLPLGPQNVQKGDSPLTANWPGSGLKPPAPKLGAPEPPNRPNPAEYPINLSVKNNPEPSSKGAIERVNSKFGKDLNTANSFSQYYWDSPYYHCSFYWPYYCYGYGYGYKYLPLYTPYWRKWNSYYAYPYYNYYDNYYDDFWYRR